MKVLAIVQMDHFEFWVGKLTHWDSHQDSLEDPMWTPSNCPGETLSKFWETPGEALAKL